MATSPIPAAEPTYESGAVKLPEIASGEPEHPALGQLGSPTLEAPHGTGRRPGQYTIRCVRRCAAWHMRVSAAVAGPMYRSPSVVSPAGGGASWYPAARASCGDAKQPVGRVFPRSG